MKQILIVEDELLIAEDIKLTLKELGYNVLGPCMRANDALEILEAETVDLVLLDIIIKGSIDGVELAQIIKEQYNIPYIFLTSHSNPKTVERAINSQPEGYIVKPFSKPDLYTAIELALSRQSSEQEIVQLNQDLKNNYLFLKVDGIYTKILFSDVDYFRSAGNYIEVHTEKNKLLIRMTFKELAQQLSTKQFIQIHKSFVININKVSAFTSKEVIIKDTKLTLARTYKETFFKTIGV